jgi:membrane associated rhomboid family serine protease
MAPPGCVAQKPDARDRESRSIMGIHERSYYRDEPPRRSAWGGGGGRRLGGMSAWSITTWIIAINVAVFVVDAFMAKHGLPVYQSHTQLVEDLPANRVVSEGYVVFDQLGRPVEIDANIVGTVVHKLVLDADSQQLVGTQDYLVRPPLEALGHFSTYRGFGRLEVWRLVTFQFLHSRTSIWHLAFNMFGLFIFGRIVEETLGRRKYLAFYLVSGIFGGLLYLLLNLVSVLFHVDLPGALAVDARTPLIGASAGVFGVIMACAYIAPKMMVRLLFPPISLTMRTMAYAYLALAVFNLLRSGSNAGGDAAHVGGAIAGAYFIRNSHLLLDFFDIFGDSRKRKRPGSSAVKRPTPSAAAKRRAREESQVDAILAKVKDEGIASLTDKEKKLLAGDTKRRRGDSNGRGG